jgi:UDP-N-acetylglucosamine 2-epimerase (non-hydrolysing)
MQSGRRTVLSVVGTRPNLMKTAPVLLELARRPDRFRSVLVHTGQHYDDEMSSIFFDDLGVASPDYQLGIGSGSHAQQTARVMERLEPVLEQEQPDLVLVPGDVNSTLAAALTAAKLAIPVAHLEAGLRSFDRSMPEEVNRVLVDAIASIHFTHSPEARDQLRAEGISDSSIHAVGNTMIDTLFAMRDRPEVQAAPERFQLDGSDYLLVTLHRPALVDGPLLAEAAARLADVAQELVVVFPVHPRTRVALDAAMPTAPPGLRLLPPLGYRDFLGLMAAATAVLTDSGGVQEETTALGIPCFTLRETTERPVTVSRGTNIVLGLAPARIAEVPGLLRACAKRAGDIPGWDGKAAMRVVEVMSDVLWRSSEEHSSSF